MSKHTYITPNVDARSLVATGAMPKHRATHITVDGIDYLTDGTLVQCVDQFGQDLDFAIIIGMCGCGCGQFDVAPVGYEDDIEWSIAQNSGLAVRVEDWGMTTVEGLPMVKFLGIYKVR